MAQPVGACELAAWQGEGVRVSTILDALDRMRHGEQRTATRTSVVNLVAIATDDAEERRACEATLRLGGRHPGRTVVVRCANPDDAESRIDAEVVLQGSEAEGVDIWWEEVRLHVTGPAARHLDSLVEPLTLPEIPTAVWFVGRLPSPADPLLATADVVLVDTKEAPTEFAAVAELVQRYPVVDLTWIRLQPWRRLLAALFDGSAYGPFVRQVTTAEVSGKEGPRRLLAGWLAERLDLLPAAVKVRDDRHVSIRLIAGPATFTVTRRPGERMVRAGAHVEGGPSHDDVLSLPDESLPWSLGEALTHLGRDRGYERALQSLLGFAP
ncbi:MAG TPA: glucose-6-phosphate dehydrogenase assembly protein OpcA [Acidimicrobiales bacterium]|nr:glucose-6-phosphate dehydrogenase assembly protein OpcA [Acidimicrobiales bacterium]